MRTPRAAQSPPRRRPVRRLKRLLAVGAALGGLLGGTAMASAQGATAAGLPTGSQFHNHPQAVHHWVAANPNDHRQPLIADRIASQPQGVWYANYAPGSITSEVSAVTSAASAAGEIPVLVSYMIPNRDCGGASSGGAPDFPSYLSWAQNFAAGLGSDPVVVILEPDSVSLTNCLDDSQRAERFSALAQSAQTMKAANPQARVYFDAGHSAWHPPARIAGLLRDAGILQSGDGFYSNASNYRSTEDEVAYAEAVIAELGDPDLRAIIDTSRNGNGPAPDSEWCDPPGRAVGLNPTTDTGNALVDAYLWIKLPGELDGCDGPAGQFSPDKAYELAGG